MSDSLFDYPDAVGHLSDDDFVFLPEWSEDEWAQLLRHAEARSFEAGDLVIRSGDTENSLAIIAEGHLEVLRPRGRLGRLAVVHVCRTGSVIGEQAFVDGRPRSATVRAVSAGRLLRLGRDNFETFSGHYPALARRFLYDLARILSLRLRQANALLEREGR